MIDTTLPTRLLVSSLLPLAESWIAAQQRRILRDGVALNETELADARALGVAAPEDVRLLRVAEVPLPENALIRRLGLALGLLSPATTGLAAGHGIFIRADHWRDRALVAHELVHTAQYERLGGVRPFLRAYLTQCLIDGYAVAALEREAVDRSHGLVFG